MELNGHMIPAGTNVMLVNFFLHRNKDSFNDPNTFNPGNSDKNDFYTLKYSSVLILMFDPKNLKVQ